MYGVSKMKRVTDSLLHYFSSSGSEHSAHGADDDISYSSTFSDLIFSDDSNRNDQSPENDKLESDLSVQDSVDNTEDILKIKFNRDSDLFRNVLESCVYKALEIFRNLKSNKSMLRRNVMACLRNYGYNAAVCKTKWESCSGLNGGTHEFIDVIKSDSYSTRYFIDLDFESQFEIARPTCQYEKLLNSLPKVFIGTIEELKIILRTMCNAARRSLKTGGLSLPPWRKNRFMQNKWLCSYKRTTNIVPSTANSTATVMNSVKCRTVGFHAAAANATTRTR